MGMGIGRRQFATEVDFGFGGCGGTGALFVKVDGGQHRLARAVRAAAPPRRGACLPVLRGVGLHGVDRRGRGDPRARPDGRSGGAASSTARPTSAIPPAIWSETTIAALDASGELCAKDSKCKARAAVSSASADGSGILHTLNRASGAGVLGGFDAACALVIDSGVRQRKAAR